MMSRKQQRSTEFIRWKFPSAGWHKLNSDGASKGNSGLSGWGGIVREERGFLMYGFALNIGICSAYNAEFWGFLRGLKLLGT